MACKFEEVLKKAGQHDVLRFWDELSGPEKQAMERELLEVENRIGLRNLKALLAETSFCAEKQDAKSTEPPRAETYGYADKDSA
ncbi:hypothetical protein DIPPA_35296 [Diplonema papillatum]|nr:hypothetical protein DIPPA_35296 [Diplonema papillatum]